MIAFNRYFLSPLLYALSGIGVFVLMGAALGFLEQSIGLHAWHRVGDVDAVVALITLGIPIFLIVTRALIRLEGLRRSCFYTHFRHCVLLYIAAILLAVALAVYYQNLNGALQYAYLVGLFASCALAILINGITLFRYSRSLVDDRHLDFKR